MNNQWFSKIAVWLVIALVLFTVFKQFDGRTTSGASSLAYSDFLDEVRMRRIKSALIQEGQGGTEIVAVTTDDRNSSWDIIAGDFRPKRGLLLTTGAQQQTKDRFDLLRRKPKRLRVIPAVRQDFPLARHITNAYAIAAFIRCHFGNQRHAPRHDLQEIMIKRIDHGPQLGE